MSMVSVLVTGVKHDNLQEGQKSHNHIISKSQEQTEGTIFEKRTRQQNRSILLQTTHNKETHLDTLSSETKLKYKEPETSESTQMELSTVNYLIFKNITIARKQLSENKKAANINTTLSKNNASNPNDVTDQQSVISHRHTRQASEVNVERCDQCRRNLKTLSICPWTNVVHYNASLRPRYIMHVQCDCSHHTLKTERVRDTSIICVPIYINLPVKLIRNRTVVNITIQVSVGCTPIPAENLELGSSHHSN